MKYLVKSVDMMSPRTVINAKNSPVPMHREGGRTRPILALVAVSYTHLAAVFSAKATGVQDQGAVAGQYFLEGLWRYFL